MKAIDLDTAEGVAVWVKGLPTENLKAIAARPVFVCAAGSNVLLVTAAEVAPIVDGGGRVQAELTGIFVAHGAPNNFGIGVAVWEVSGDE